jgi:hypothetical protein
LSSKIVLEQDPAFFWFQGKEIRRREDVFVTHGTEVVQNADTYHIQTFS